MEYRIKLCFVLLFALLSQHKSLAFNAENMLGKWGVTTFAFIPEGGDFNSGNISYINANVGWDFYFNENGKGNVVIPARGPKYKNIEFKWSLSNDTLNIVHIDTLAQFRIDKTRIKNGIFDLYLRLLKPGGQYFNKSYIASSLMVKATDFLYDPNFKSMELDSTILKNIEKIKERKEITKIVIGYQGKDNKIYYSDNNVQNARSNFSIFDEIINGERKYAFVLFVMYDIEKKSFVKLSRMSFYYDEYLPEKVECSSCKDFPLDE